MQHIKSFVQFVNESHVEERIEFLEKYKKEAEKIKKYVYNIAGWCSRNKKEYDKIPTHQGNATLYTNVPESIFAHKEFKLGDAKVLLAFMKCSKNEIGGFCMPLFLDQNTGRIMKDVIGSTIIVRMVENPDEVWRVVQHEIGHALDAARSKKRGYNDVRFQGGVTTLADEVRNDIANLDDKAFKRLVDRELDDNYRRAMIRSRKEMELEKNISEEDEKILGHIVKYVASSLYLVFDKSERSSHIIDGSLTETGRDRILTLLDKANETFDTVEVELLKNWDKAIQVPWKQILVNFIAQNIEKMKFHNREGENRIDKTDRKKVKFFVGRGRKLVEVMKKKIEKNFKIYNSNKDELFKNDVVQ